MKKKVLYYNWCPLSERVGGGIAVYQKNLFSHFQQQQPNFIPYFLCSGFYYDQQKETYLRQEEETVYSIVNSPIYAPVQTPADNIEKMIHHQELTDMVERFLREKGPFQAIHFQSMEGLPLSVLALKEKFPETKFIYSLHNYLLFCPNVQLWTCDHENCFSKKEFDCAKCMRKYQAPSTQQLKFFRTFLTKGKRRAYWLSRVYAHLFYHWNVRRKSNYPSPEILQSFRQECVKHINQYVDEVLAVSRRVKEIALFFGIREDRLTLSYIGTKFASLASYQGKERKEEETLRLVYMGYMRKEKGFYFFLEALEKMEEEIAKNIVVTFASKLQDPLAYQRMQHLKKKFREIIFYNGYRHQDIQIILANSDLGVVPVLWEDNLPQVAIEMVANGVPVLASDFGGPSELNRHPSFVHKGADQQNFLAKIYQIYHHPHLLKEYWQYAQRLQSMEEHIDFLEKIYGVENEL